MPTIDGIVEGGILVGLCGGGILAKSELSSTFESPVPVVTTTEPQLIQDSLIPCAFETTPVTLEAELVSIDLKTSVSCQNVSDENDSLTKISAQNVSSENVSAQNGLKEIVSVGSDAEIHSTNPGMITTETNISDEYDEKDSSLNIRDLEVGLSINLVAKKTLATSLLESYIDKLTKKNIELKPEQKILGDNFAQEPESIEKSSSINGVAPSPPDKIIVVSGTRLASKR